MGVQAWAERSLKEKDLKQLVAQKDRALVAKTNEVAEMKEKEKGLKRKVDALFS